jgi:hypothetical protein
MPSYIIHIHIHFAHEFMIGPLCPCRTPRLLQIGMKAEWTWTKLSAAKKNIILSTEAKINTYTLETHAKKDTFWNICIPNILWTTSDVWRNQEIHESWKKNPKRLKQTDKLFSNHAAAQCSMGWEKDRKVEVSSYTCRDYMVVRFGLAVRLVNDTYLVYRISTCRIALR